MSRSIRDVMWVEALTTLARTERLHRPAFSPTDGGWEPPVDVLETENGLLIVVALPGVRRDDMEVVISDGELTVRGTRRWLTIQRPVRVLRVELPHGRFERRLPLPHGTYRLIHRDHTDGCLVLTLRRLD